MAPDAQCQEAVKLYHIWTGTFMYPEATLSHSKPEPFGHKKMARHVPQVSMSQQLQKQSIDSSQ